VSVESARNYFELFDIPVAFDIDLNDLSSRYQELQRQVHPDKFATATDQERRISVQQTANINEAFRVLKDPLQRGRYLLELYGVRLDDEMDTSSDTAFLMEQMALREALAEIREQPDPVEALLKLIADIDARERELIDTVKNNFNNPTTGALQRARNTIQKLQFIKRLQEEAAELEEELF
jgi:molecular chaperone HscB